jgi:biotin synthase
VLRGVTEINNVCRVNCDFCPMRRDNTRENDSFHMSSDALVESARNVHEAGIDVVFFQAGEVPQTTRTVGGALPEIVELYGGSVEILLNLGNKRHDEYAELRELGATSYILKHETSDPALNAAMRHETLESRLEHLQDLLDLGYRVGTGAIVGLPGQTVESVAEDIRLASELAVHMCSFSPFVPAPNTPLESLPPGSIDLTLNAVAVSRITHPEWLIPSVSALEKTGRDGQLRGFDAGANVMTINFTPPAHTGQYLIYGKDRFVVRRAYAAELLGRVSLQPTGSVFLKGGHPARAGQVDAEVRP